MILCAGEAVVDMFPNQDGAFAPVAGGAALNTAIGLGRQGAAVGLVSGISTDLFGTFLQKALTDSRVSPEFLHVSHRPTTLAFVALQQGSAQYAFYDENSAGRMLTPADMPQSLPSSINALLFGGISWAVEPCAKAYVNLMQRCAAKHLIMFDPNIRPNFIANEAHFRQRLALGFELADVVKVSEEDLLWLDPSPVSRSAKASAILGHGTQLVCITRGADGVEVFGAQGLHLSVPAPKTTVVDTVGAGDAFNAGFLCALERAQLLSKTGFAQAQADDILSALTFAVAFASETTKSVGSDPPWNFCLSMA